MPAIELTTAPLGTIDGIRDSLEIDRREMGVVRYHKTSWTDLSDFTVVGATPTIVNGCIRLTAAFGNWDSQRIMLSPVRADRDWTFSAKLRFNDLNTGYGVAIGKASINGWGYKQSIAGSLSPINAYAAAIYREFEGNITSSLVNTPIPLFAKDEVMEVTLVSRRSVITYTARNVATGAQIVLTTTAGTNCGRFGIANIGSSVDIMEITYTADIPKHPKQVFFVDSKGCGTPGDNYISWIDRLTPSRGIAIFGGPADRTVELMQAAADFPSVGITDAIMAIGRNDTASGVSASVTQANILALRAPLVAQGAAITHVIVPETTQNQSVMSAWVPSALPNDQIVDLSGYNIATMEYSDLVHSNAVGQTFVARQAEKKISLPSSELDKSPGLASIPNTTGLTLGNLEAEVNKLKAVLRSAGMISP